MPFDTVIDKAQLEKEMSASADAIRARTNTSDPIEWVPDKGFADAIIAIAGSGAYPIAEEGFF